MAVTVSNVTINKTIIGPEETFVLSYDVVNTDSSKISYFELTLYYNVHLSSTVTVMHQPARTRNGAPGIDQPKNTTRHYSLQFTAFSTTWSPSQYEAYRNVFKWLYDNGYRGTDREDVGSLTLMWVADTSSNSYYGNISIPDVKCITSYCTPAVDTFDLQRATSGQPDDEGQSLLMSAKLSIQDQTWLSGMGCTLYYAQGTAVDPATASSVDLTAHISDLLAGVTDDSTLITGTFSRGDDWAFLLAFGDQYESASASEQVFRAFANFHLSGAALGGAAFGRFSSADDTHPKLECEYPAYFNAGIAGVSTYPLLASGATATAEELTGGKWIDGKPIYRVVIFKTVTLAASTTVATMPAYETIVSCHCLAKIGSDTKPVPFAYYNNNNWEMNWAISQTGVITMQVGSGHRQSARVQFIIEYTKTTD